MSEHRGIISDLSHEQYLAVKTAVSHSMLKIIAEQSEMHLRAYLDAPEEPPTEAQRIGTIAHRCLLLPDTMSGAFHIKPEGMKFTTKDGIAWRDAHQDRPIIAEAEMKTIEAMVAAVHRHPVAKRLLANAAFEQSIFVEDQQGTLRKIRPDILPKSGNLLPDLKTCGSAHPDEFTKTLTNYRYWSQGDFYLTGTRLLGMEFAKFGIIAVEKEPPHAVAVYVVEDFAVEYGHRINEALIQRYRNAIESGVWPGYPEQLTYIGLSKWLQREADQAA